MQPVTHELGAGRLRVGERERDVDRLLAGRLDERARVHDDEVGSPARRRGHETVGEQGRDDLVGVDGVLRAAERLDVEARRRVAHWEARHGNTPGGHPHIVPTGARVHSAPWLPNPTVWCPSCGAEYRADTTQCADCRVALVPEQPVFLDADDSGLVELGEWPRVQAQVLRRRLETAGVPVMIEWSGPAERRDRRSCSCPRTRPSSAPRS